MKILYIAQERSAAQVAGTALRRLVPDTRMSWARDTGGAIGWLRDNGDAAAVFADCGSENPEFEAFLAEVRSLGVTTPIAAVAPEHLQALSAALKANLDGLVDEERNKSEQERNKSEVLAAQLAESREWRLEAEQRSEEQDAALASSARICDSLQERLVEVEAALHGADERCATQTAAIEPLVRREAELSAAVAEAIAVRAAIERRLTDTEVAGQHAEQRAAEDLTAAGERYAILADHLIRETAVRTTVEERLAAAEYAREDDHRTHALELAALTARLGEREAHHEAASARIGRICTALQQRLLELEAAIHTADERHAADTATVERLALRERELSTAVADGLAVRTALESRLAEAEAVHHQAQQGLAAELAETADRYGALEGRLREEVNARTTVESRLSATELASDEAGRQYATELSALTARFEQRLAEAESAGRDSERQHGSELASLTAQLADVEAQHQAAMAQHAKDAGELTRQLNAMRARAAALRCHAVRVSVLERQLDESFKENRRQFERAPHGLCECTREGVVTRVNHTLARMLGYRSTDLQRMNIAATIFESAGDVHWLLERTLESGTVESVETTLKTLDRRRLFVRLHALSANGPVVIAVEDLTRLCALEQRLREAQRMEAVGRVASEVAVTCDTLLQDVSQGGRQWLAVFESDTPIRQQGELLLGDVTRAAGFLRQFAIYGHQQMGNVEPVSVPRLLREMAPVLKRVLGDDITLLLPKTTDRFEVDVDAERVERILVNVANYARERMPNGGRVRLQLATVVVDRKFLASHPRVRPGAHVLITITEVQGAVWPALPIHLPIGRSAQSDAARARSDKPGMDLGLLVALIGELGGHLWMSAEPAGNVTLQIHLPKRIQDEIVDADTTASWSDRGRQLTRWFRH